MAKSIEATRKDGNIIMAKADYFVTAVDATVLLKKLLEGKYEDSFYSERFGNPDAYPLFTEVDVHLGINANFSDLPRSVIFKTSKIIDCGGGENDYIGFKHFCEDPYFMEDGKSVVTVSFVNVSYDYWKKLREHSIEDYNNEKKHLADEVIRELTIQYPELTDKFEMVDVVTILTYERYCGAIFLYIAS